MTTCRRLLGLTLLIIALTGPLAGCGNCGAAGSRGGSAGWCGMSMGF